MFKQKDLYTKHIGYHFKFRVISKPDLGRYEQVIRNAVPEKS